MAEGLLRELAGNRFEVHSAGTQPAAEVHPLAVQVMAERGIDISHQRTKDVREFLGRMAVAYLVIVCDGADKSCPRVFPGMRARLFWPFDDPAQFVGTEQAKLEKFRAVRDQIGATLANWLDLLDQES
jgi:arsenate reductase